VVAPIIKSVIRDRRGGWRQSLLFQQASGDGGFPQDRSVRSGR
jgi:hypothetical protein